MTANELEHFLGTEESKSVGDMGSGGESTGHRSGRRIVKILRAKKADLTEDDAAHMRKVVGYLHRHLAQKPRRRQRIALAIFADELGSRPDEVIARSMYPIARLNSARSASDRSARPPGARRARAAGPAPALVRRRWQPRRRSAAPAGSRGDRWSTPPRRCGAGRVRRPGRASPTRLGKRPAARSRRPPPTPAASELRRRAAPGPAPPAPARGGPESPRTPCSSASDAPAPTSGPSMSGRTAPAGTTRRPRRARRRRGSRPRWRGSAPAASACAVVPSQVRVVATKHGEHSTAPARSRTS